MRVPRKRIVELVAYVSRRQKRRITELDIAIVNDEQMAADNMRYLKHKGTTDVISFDLSDDFSDGIVAQFIICADVAVREAAERKHGVQRELMLYVVHGLLHMMGYDDIQADMAAKMHVRQETLLNDFLVFSSGETGG